MKRSRNRDRPRGSTALPSRSNSMMSSAVTSAGASERDIRKWLGFLGSRALTWPKPSRTPNSARMRLPITISSIGVASLPDGAAAEVWACACGKTNKPAQTVNNIRHVAAIATSFETASGKDRLKKSLDHVSMRLNRLLIALDLKNGLKGAAQGFVAEHESVAEPLGPHHTLPPPPQPLAYVAPDPTQQRIGTPHHP